MTAEGQIEITNCFDPISCSDMVADVKTCGLVNGIGKWKANKTADGKKLLNPTLTQAEDAKNTKHEGGYAVVGMSFVAFMVW